MLSEETDNDSPEKYQLYQNYPNPFNPRTTIEYYLPEHSFLTLKVVDALGKEVITLINEEQKSGSYKVTFDVSSINPRLASGIYFYRLSAIGKSNDFIQSKKMIYLK